MNKDEWLEHRFGDIVLRSPAQLTVTEIGNGTWYLLLKWNPKYTTEEIALLLPQNCNGTNLMVSLSLVSNVF